MTTLLLRTRQDPPAAPVIDVAPAVAALSAPTLRDLLAYYLAEVLPSLAPNTRYQRRRWAAMLDTAYGQLPLTALTPAWLRRWRDHLSLRLKPDSVRQYLDTISAVLTVAVTELAWLPAHPMHGRQVRKPAASRGRVRFLSPEEQQRLLAACRVSPKPGLYPLVFLALTTGARRGELLGLHWLDVDLERGWLRLEQTKNKQPRAVPVPTVALELLRAWRQEAAQAAWVFPRASTRTPWPYEYAWSVVLLQAGLAGTFRFHDLRHTAASYLAMSGASLIEIAEILGHKTLAMVRRYAHFTAGHTAGVVERMATQFVPSPASPEGAAHGAV